MDAEDGQEVEREREDMTHDAGMKRVGLPSPKMKEMAGGFSTSTSSHQLADLTTLTSNPPPHL